MNTVPCIVQGVLAGLLARVRTGEGRRVEITMAGAAMALQRVRLAEHPAGRPTPPMSCATTWLCSDRAIEAQDGPVMVSMTGRRQWRAFGAATGCDALQDDPRFATNPLRLRHRDALIPLPEPPFRDRPAWRRVQVLTRAGVPEVQQRPMETLPTDQHVAENAMLRRFDTTDRGRITAPGPRWRVDGTPEELRPGSPPVRMTRGCRAGAGPDLDPAERRARSLEKGLKEGT